MYYVVYRLYADIIRRNARDAHNYNVIIYINMETLIRCHAGLKRIAISCLRLPTIEMENKVERL